MNKVLPALLITVFILILALDCVFILNTGEEYRIYTKPLLMPVLYILLVVQTADSQHKKSKLYISLALLFSFLGDFLLLNGELNFYFIAGLLFFLLSHICYITLFLRLKSFSSKRITGTILISLFIVLYLCLLLNRLWSNISTYDLEIPVIAYALVIGFMLLTALNTGSSRRVRKVAFLHFIPGAILFVLSDSVLAINRFSSVMDKTLQVQSNLTYPVIIIVSYGLAQLLLITGAIRIIKK